MLDVGCSMFMPLLQADPVRPRWTQPVVVDRWASRNGYWGRVPRIPFHDILMRQTIPTAACLLLLLVGAPLLHAADKLWTAEPLTKPKEFTAGIEGPACDAAGNIFAVNYARQQTIGRV